MKKFIKKFISVEEAAEILDVDRKFIEKSIAQGELIKYKFSRRCVRLKLIEFEDWYESKKILRK